MIIKNKSNESRVLRDFLSFLRRKKKLRILSIIVLIGVICCSLVSYGVYLNRNKKIDGIVHFGADLLQTRGSFIGNLFYSFTSSPNQFVIDIKFKHLDRINALVDIANSTGFIEGILKTQEFPAKLTLNGIKYRVELSMTGQYLDHIGPDRNSFNVKVKDDKTIMGMSKFKLLIPATRGYLADWVGHEMQSREGLVVPRFDFVEVKINGENKGIFAIEESYNTDLIENNNLRDGIIFRPGLEKITVLNQGKIRKDINRQNRVTNLENIWQSYLNGEISPEDIFDLEKFAVDYATTDLISGLHSKFLLNLRYYYNPITNLVEPISREFGFMRNGYELIGKEKTNIFIKALYEDSELSVNDKKFHKKIFSSFAFQKLYAKNLERLSDVVYLDNFLILIEGEMTKKERIIYKDNPFYNYPKRFLYENQKMIKSFLHPPAQFVSGNLYTNSDKLIVSFINKSLLPVRINYVQINDSIILRPNDETYVHPSFYGILDSIELEGNCLEDSLISKISFCYNVIGIEDSVRCSIMSNINDVSISINPSTMSPSFLSLDFITIDTLTNQISVPEGFYTLSKTYSIPSGYNVKFSSGVNIDLTETGGLVSRSALFFQGTKNSPVVITSSNASNTGITVLNAEQTSSFRFVEISNLHNHSSPKWNLTGPITFYNSDVIFENCVFRDNLSGDDLLNIVRSSFEINQCLFENSLADALDADFCNGKIMSTVFINSGNDAIDISGSELEIHDVLIDGAMDKALSAGEKSTIRGVNVKITNSEIAICSKDQSEITLNSYHLENNQIGLVAFQKKSKFGPGYLKLSEGISINNTVDYLIELNSICVIDDVEVYSNNTRVKDLLYGVKYGKSSK